MFKVSLTALPVHQLLLTIPQALTSGSCLHWSMLIQIVAADLNARSFTKKQAKSIGVTGFVSNASDGSVRGEAQGTSDQLKEFVQHLSKGPSAASVSGVEQNDISSKSGENGFNVQ